MEDQTIARAIGQRDEAVFAQVVAEYSKLLWAVGYGICGKQVAAVEIEELVSDVFFRFWRQPEKYDPAKGSLKNYLALMTKSMALNRIKAHRNDFSVEDDFLLETLPEKSETGEGALIWQSFFQAIQTLKEPTREICLQRFFFERKPAAISRELGLSLTEVNNRLYKGKQKIKLQMQKLLKEAESR